MEIALTGGEDVNFVMRNSIFVTKMLLFNNVLDMNVFVQKNFGGETRNFFWGGNCFDRGGRCEFCDEKLTKMLLFVSAL